MNEEICIEKTDFGTGLYIKRPVSKGVRAIGIVLMIMLPLGILELASYEYLRIFEGYDGHHLMNYEFDDYKNIRPTPRYVDTRGVTHNSQGFREIQDTPLKKDPHVYRIFIMGGSTGYGVGGLSQLGKTKYPIIPNEHTIDSYLERYIKGKAGLPDVEVINAAITSHQSHHHLIYLNQTILKYDPDMVIFIDGFNDYYKYDKGFDQFRDYAYQERVHQYMAEPTFAAWAGYTGWWLFRSSHFVHLAGKSFLPVWQYVRSIGQPRVKMDIETALANLKENAMNNFVKMVERNSLLLKHEGVAAVFTLQPELIFRQSKQFTAFEQDLLNEMNERWQEGLAEFKDKARPLVVGFLDEATAKTGSHFINLTDPFGGMSEDAFTDYCHLTPEGNKRLAEYLGERLLAIIEGHGRSKLRRN
jgi:lysophospholipase L1-like esterase